MAEITAKLVNELRMKTGQGMMECKKALQETGGELEKAIEFFRKKGVKASLTERTASEGRIVGVRAKDGKTAALVEVLCNTDFTAKSEPLQVLAKYAAEKLATDARFEAAADAEVKNQITQVAQQTGENVQIGRTAVLSNAGGAVGMYLYAINSKIGVLLSLSGDAANVTAELVSDVGGHIAFSNPVSLNRDGVPAELVAKEKELAVEQAKATGKPQQIAEKIAEGKLNAFFGERVLLDQEFFNAGKYKGTVGAMLKSKGLTLEKYVRLQVGAQ